MTRISFHIKEYSKGVLTGTVRFYTGIPWRESHHINSSCACKVEKNSTALTPDEGQGCLPRELNDETVYHAVQNMVRIYYDAKVNADTWMWLENAHPTPSGSVVSLRREYDIMTTPSAEER
jgi:hypothetical protein